MILKKINILCGDDQIVFYSIFPILINLKKLKLLGYEIKFYKKIEPSLENCDILILFSKSIQKIINEKSSIYSPSGKTICFLKLYQQKVNKLIWFDSSDSTSVTHFEVMPFVDLYFKKQILRDINLYKTNFYGGRLFTDFYNKKYKVKDHSIFSNCYPLKEKYKKKLKVSWNIGIGNIFETFNKTNVFVRKFFPFLMKNNYVFDSFPYKNNRFVDIIFRGSLNYDRETVMFHRKLMYDELLRISKKKETVSVIGSKVFNNFLNSQLLHKAKKRLSIKEYMLLMSKSKISISPFGWGEIGARDFETISSGAILFKPDMSHLLTWPDYFIPNKTYIPIKWDFSDLDRKISNYLNKPKLSNIISSNAQNLFFKSLSKKGMNDFCDYFINLVNS